MRKNIQAFLQIIILVGAIISFSYIIGKSFPENNNINNKKRENIGQILGLIGETLFGFVKSVSAAGVTAEDLEIYSCPKTKDEKKCMQYVKSECNAKCSVQCAPASSINECSIGTCYNTELGICSKKSPKGECESQGLQWFNSPEGNIPQCMQGCCIINGNPKFTTEQECLYNAEKFGIKKDFRSEITSQLACIAIAEQNIEGACVFEKSPTNGCVFATKEVCQSRKGKFYANILCSNKNLNTECAPQARVGCAEGKDEVYWFDSCGNKENIYDFSNKAKLREEGKVVQKQDSCNLPSAKDLQFNSKQQTCGNCNSLLGSICGKRNNKESLVDASLDYVCRDISCIDDNGKKRANGESWCLYQGAVGEDKNRAVDTPGSNHFLTRCENGEIVKEQCGNYREKICAESRVEATYGGTFSSAQCITNLGYLCSGYNSLNADERTKQCNKNPYCFIKKVSVSGSFSFDLCAPKYKPGSERDKTEYNEALCGIINELKCKYIKVKKLFGKKEINRECLSEKFTQQMNDLCMSLGDCGAQVNYAGDLTENYKVNNAPRLGNDYLSGISKYYDEKLFKDYYAAAPSLSEYFGVIGILGDVGNAQAPDDTTASVLKQGGMIAGALGSLLPLIAHTKIGAAALGKVGLTQAAGSKIGGGTIYATKLSSFGGALAGAAIGFSITSFLISFTGIGKGLDPAATYALIAAGTIGGALAGYGIMAGAAGSATPGIAAAASAGIILIVAVIIFILVLKILGIGKVKQMDITFTCKPWAPPVGGKNCGKCGSDGFICTKSACESLGQTCQLINEDTELQECIDIAPNDITPPTLKPISISPEQYKFEEGEFSVEIKSSSECIEETYQPIFLNLEASEPARCKVTPDLQERWEDMEDLGGRSSFLRNQTAVITIPSLESLGLPGFDPKARADIKLNVFCEDKSGNKNSRAYVINFCIKQGNDTLPPIIIDKNPPLDKIRIDAREINASIYTNEPSECKWDATDKEYNLMANEMQCSNEIEDYTIRGFKCDALFQTPKNDNTFYIRCKDQPWYAEKNESLRNEMPESYIFNLTKVSNPLMIKVISPLSGSIIEAESEPASVKIEVKSEGGLDGNAECFYKYKDSTNLFENTFSSTHSNTFSYFLEGNIEIPIICKDAIGNIAEEASKFSIKLDTTPPNVARVYKKGSDLYIITEKNGKCSFSTDLNTECRFEYNKGIEMSGGGLLHTSSFDDKNTYFIKCKNKFNKTPGGCSMIVRGGKI